MTLAVSAPVHDHSGDLADWIELKVLAEGDQRVSRSYVRRELRDATGVTGEDLDQLVDLAFSEMQRRVDIAAEAYPFIPSQSGFNLRDGGNQTPYAFLLFLSVSPDFRQRRRQNEAARIFEEILTIAVRRYLGPHAEAVRFGTPASGDRPVTWRGAIYWLAEHLRVGRGPGRIEPKKQDGGVDVVGWIPFRDSRAGQLVILVQATIEHEWWSSNKHKEIEPQVWIGWIDFGRLPCTGFAIPFAIPSNFPHWDELRRSVDVVFDRSRLCSVLGGAAQLEPAAQAWVDREAGRLIN